MFKPCIRRVDFLWLKQTIGPAIVFYLVTDSLFADLASKGFIMIVNAVRRLNFPHFALDPILQAQIMDQLHAARALADIKEGIALLGAAVKAKPANCLVAGPLSKYTFFHIAIAWHHAEDIAVLHS